MYSLSDKKEKKKFKFDYILFCSVFMLSIFGIIVLCSATATNPSGSRMVMVQIASMILGIGICVVLNFLDYNIFKSLSTLLYIFGILLLVAVLRFGTDILGSRRWLIIPVINMSFQPSELTKIFYILFISKHFEKLSKEFNKKPL